MHPLPLFKGYKERGVFFIIILFIFAINTFIEYTQYKHFKTNEPNTVYRGAIDTVVTRAVQKLDLIVPAKSGE